ncbi:MAG: hypothetical protein EB060_03965 [Proteobacteria bacterium]|nr:hypothetical protein [Pseudomonadota bacterium]
MREPITKEYSMKPSLKITSLTLLTATLLSSAVLAQSISSGSASTTTNSHGSTSNGIHSHSAVGNSATNRNSSAASDMRAGSGSSRRSTTISSDWNAENDYWHNQYPSRPYYDRGRAYSTVEPAYRYGVDLYNQNPGRRYEELNQSQLSSGWDTARGTSTMNWNDAQNATRDAYNRMYDQQQRARNGANR